MTPQALVAYLHEHIPLSRAMDVSVLLASAEEVVLEAPLNPNINVHGTMFGGSVGVLGLLAAWSVLHLRLEAEGIANQLVIHKTETEYLRPIGGTARAVARLDGADWGGFIHTLQRRHKARLTVSADLEYAGELAARLRGEFVSILEG
ncbi:thioesterase domain-containing protein, putative [Devosia lucknowensis]|uniref:Thioesterase domain-containing protein, putative n=1 Tax=Devosia lucknowensis TaxID=1096929 RepID=A0A1Y6ETL0_9HYPH|nr:YiiD C-terminal domain-containing protein [Devosia lucknowensis]SMQ63852.1 thioesterase domain-containing protein, putative [Devosia lucknowensis]